MKKRWAIVPRAYDITYVTFYLLGQTAFKVFDERK